MWLRKSAVPGAAPGGYAWSTADEAVEVPDYLGLELLAIPGAGFSEVAPPPPESGPGSDVVEEPEEPAAEDVAQAPRRPARPRKTAVSE